MTVTKTTKGKNLRKEGKIKREKEVVKIF